VLKSILSGIREIAWEEDLSGLIHVRASLFFEKTA